MPVTDGGYGSALRLDFDIAGDRHFLRDFADCHLQIDAHGLPDVQSDPVRSNF